MKVRHTHKILLSLILLFIILGISGCGYMSVKVLSEEPEKYLGEEVIVKGTVENTIKIGNLSGFTLRDGNYSIAVSSKTLPEEGKIVSVKGTVMKEVIIGYYIYAKKIY